MSIVSKKIVAAGLAALTLGGAMAISTNEASARGWRGGYHGGYYRGGWGGPALGLGALAIGAGLAASAYSDCYIVRRPVVNRYGTVIGYRRVRVC